METTSSSEACSRAGPGAATPISSSGWKVPSGFGPFSYELADTKLKRRPDPKHVLQIVLYSDLLCAALRHADGESQA